ncbi:hypothetical protein [Komagataeibacter xylinus]|uniref:hypothetical protein n=1 Tax=Komagataeibacter xylinus TaxID=28448 RepID=UPI0013ED6FCE|nr:hypothetical protein [Komagataeibacter xylinus]
MSTWPCDKYPYGSPAWFQCLLEQLKKVGGDDWAEKINGALSNDDKEILLEELSKKSET